MNSDKKIVYLFLPYHNTGGHFISWSLNYLSSNPTYRVNGKSIVLEDLGNDFDNKNFHHHTPYFAFGFDEVKQTEQEILNFSKNKINFVYVPTVSFYQSARYLFNTNDLYSLGQEQVDSINKHKNDDTAEMLPWIQNNHTLIMFNYDKRDLLNICYNDRFPVDLYNNPASIEQAINALQSVFFADTLKQFDVKHIWDLRERMALTIRPTTYIDYRDFIDRTKPHLYYTTGDVWDNFQNCILAILQYLELPVDSVRYQVWRQIYKNWREKHESNFSRHFDDIISAIVNNYYMDLSHYNMNFYQEVLIQHELIFNHNLNFKTWQLEKFPSNTQDLHKLLEPNIHTL